MKIHDENCEGCVSTVGEDVCFSDIKEMMEYHKSQRNWFVAKWEDYIYYPIYNFVRWKFWDKVRPGKIKHYYQRAQQGYSYMDNWSIDLHLVEILIPMFENLKINHISVPMSYYTEEDGVDKDGNPIEEADIKAEQRKQNIYNEIIYGLKCAKLIQSGEYDFQKDSEYKRLNKSVKRSFELMGEHFFTFWD